jgi:1-acyl-sn-glycerol-3-phosphate acyltransferase
LLEPESAIAPHRNQHPLLLTPHYTTTSAGGRPTSTSKWRSSASFAIEVRINAPAEFPHTGERSVVADKLLQIATGISPFLPVNTPLSAVSILTHTILFIFRLPLFLVYAASYFVLFHHLPLPVIARKMALWGLMAIPGIWWVDLQLDGVKRGTLSDQPLHRFPHPGSIIAANFTSPIDAVYLAAIFDPVFTVSYPGERRVERVSLFGAIIQALAPVKTAPPPGAKLVEIKDLLKAYPDRVIAVFPESGTSNGKAVLPFSPSLVETPSDVPMFPVSIRYAPPDVTTPVPGLWFGFLWSLLSRPTSCIRVRIADSQLNTAAANTDSAHSSNGTGELKFRGDGSTSTSAEEKRVLDRVGEALARLGRVKRVGLTMKDKAAFVNAYNKKKP